MRFRSLAARISLLVAVAVGLSVALLASVAYAGLQHQLVASLDDSLCDRAEEAASLGSATLTTAPPAWLLGAADLQFALITARGQGAVRPPTGTTDVLKLDAVDVAVARGETDRVTRDASLEKSGDMYRICVVPGPEEGLAVALGQSLEPTQKTVGRLGVILVLSGLVGVVTAALAGAVVARNGLRPVRRLTDAAEEIARTAQLNPIRVEGDDELARLAIAFNSMLAALSASRDRQRQLVADAGHELRTPLTSLRTNIDLLAQADRRGGLSPEQRRELMDDVRFQIDELTSLIGDLTELARDEPILAQLEPLDLADVVARAVDRVRRRTMDVEFEVTLESTWVTGEASSLERAVTNLLDNAVKWSPADGRVTVTLRHGILHVADQGPGIAEQDLPHVFERFYRSRESRTMPGSGLGLSIVRNVAERHGGEVRAGHAEGGGAAFWLRVPTRPAPAAQSTEGSQERLRADSATRDNLGT